MQDRTFVIALLVPHSVGALGPLLPRTLIALLVPDDMILGTSMTSLTYVLVASTLIAWRRTDTRCGSSGFSIVGLPNRTHQICLANVGVHMLGGLM